MDIFSIITSVFLAALTAVIATVLLLTALVLAIIFLVTLFGVIAGIKYKYRQPLARKLQFLRLNKMLAALGIDTYDYLTRESLVTINEHMERCTECTNIEECDERMSNESTDINNIDYCNNESSLKEIISKK